MECKPKNPKRVEQGKRLAEFNKERFARRRQEEDEKRQKEEEEFETSLLEYEKWKGMNDDALTISSPQEEGKEKETSKFNFLIPAFALTVVGVGTFWYYRGMSLHGFTT